MEILNDIECEKCKVKAQPGIVISRLNKMWICGRCLVNLQEKIDKLKKEILIEECQ